ncbi:MAG: toll/interleukin-1 receptor domain-containing protein [Ruminococcus sp.]|nr:toll/interleukin-1 receptor domain-containing protein [Ruminococcus sp.]
MPTCHRTSFEKIQDIPEFRKVLEYSDVSLRNVYIQLSEVINGIQQRILAIAVNEKPFDMLQGNRRKRKAFSGRISCRKTVFRTYPAEYKSIFCTCTLRDKLGTEFEPYIYSAINSAQIMICVGTSAEHFDSVWVRNEWSRFIELMKKDKSKILIPCYENMSVSQLPIEFRDFRHRIYLKQMLSRTL